MTDLEYLENEVIVVIMAGTRENFYDQLKLYMKNVNKFVHRKRLL